MAGTSDATFRTKKAGVSVGYGIDDDSYLVFEDNQPRYFGTIYIEHNHEIKKMEA